MSTTLTVNGNNYNFPTTSEENWGTSVTNWATAISQTTLQKTGGVFTLTAALDFGSSYGVSALSLTTKTANPATTGFLNLSNTDSIAFRNAANNADLLLSLNSDTLQFNSIDIQDISTAQTITNKSIDADNNTITNLEDDNIKAGAGIDATKIADGSVTNTELQYINSLGSNAQDQIDTKTTGPGSSTDNTIPRYDSTTGKVLQTSGVVVDDSNNMTGINNLTLEGNLTVNGTTTSVNSTTLDTADANITLNKGGDEASADLADAGLTVEMSDADNALLGFDSSLASKWKIGTTVSSAEIIDASSNQVMINKSFGSRTQHANGTESDPSIAASTDSATGIYWNTDILGLTAGGNKGLEVKSISGSLSNVAIGGAGPSSSAATPLYILRDQATGTAIQLVNNNTTAGAFTGLTLQTHNTSVSSNIMNYSTSQTIASLGGRLAIRNLLGKGVSIIAASTLSGGGDIRMYAGSQNDSSEALRVNVDGSITLPQEITTPSTPDTGHQKIYQKSDKKIYRLDDSGLETELGAGAGGSGTKNFFDSDSAEVNSIVGNWLTDDGSGAASGELTITLTSTSGEVLAGEKSLHLSKNGFVDVEGHFFKCRTEAIDLINQGNAAFGNFKFNPISGYVSGDLIVELYDVTNSAVLYSGQSEDLEISNITGQINFITYLAEDTAQVELRLKINNTDTNAFTASIDEIKLGPVSQGATFANITGWKSFDGDVTGSTSGTLDVGGGGSEEYSLEYREVGDCLEITYNIRKGTTGGSDVTGPYLLPIPAGYTISKDQAAVGFGLIDVVATAAPKSRPIGRVFSGNKIILARGDTNLVTGGDGFIYDNANRFRFRAMVQVDELKATNVINTTEMRDKTIYTKHSRSTSQSITHNTQTIVQYDTVVSDDLGSITTGASWKFTAHKKLRLRVRASALYSSGTWGNGSGAELSLYKNGTQYAIIDYVGGGNHTSWNAFPNGDAIVDVEKGDYIDVRTRQSSGSTQTISASAVYNFIEIESIPDFTLFGVVKNEEKIRVFDDPFVTTAFTAGVYQDITSFSVPAGEWDVDIRMTHRTLGAAPGAAFDVTTHLHDVAGNNTDVSYGDNAAVAIANNAIFLHLPTTIKTTLNLADTTTYYLKHALGITNAANSVRLDHYSITLTRIK